MSGDLLKEGTSSRGKTGVGESLVVVLGESLAVERVFQVLKG